MEFALILPLLVFGVAVLLHIGVGLSVQMQLEAAAREGARAAAVDPDNASAEATVAIARVMDDRPTGSSTAVEAEWVTVTVETSVRFLPFTNTARTLTADATMRREDLIR